MTTIVIQFLNSTILHLPERKEHFIIVDLIDKHQDKKSCKNVVSALHKLQLGLNEIGAATDHTLEKKISRFHQHLMVKGLVWPQHGCHSWL